MNEEEKQKLIELRATMYGRALQKFLAQELDHYQDVRNATTLEELLAHQKVVALIEKLFSFMEPTKSTSRGKNEYV